MAGVSAALLGRVKQYCRIETDADDALLKMLIRSAEKHLEKAGIAKSSEPRYELSLYMLVLHWYDNRQAVAQSTNPVPLPLGLDSLIKQQKFEYAGADE